MSEQELAELRDKIWRGALSRVEARRVQNLMQADPQLREALREDFALNHLLERLPEAPPVSSNFTALVLEKIRLEEARNQRAQRKGFAVWIESVLQHRVLVRVGGVAAIVLVTGSVVYHHDVVQQRIQFAQSVATISQAFASDARFTQDLGPITKLAEPASGGDTSKADVELLALMR